MARSIIQSHGCHFALCLPLNFGGCGVLQSPWIKILSSVSFCLISLPCVYFVCVTDKVKVDFNVNGKKEDTSNGDQLSLDVKNLNLKEEVSEDGIDNGNRAQTFSFDELAAATGNFWSDCFLGEGGFGKVYKGHLEAINQVC